ncbi:MAG TPA: hypothetical protein DC014_00875 [Treponema sp.]|nr:hypothetical protein [Treponema sp.]
MVIKNKIKQFLLFCAILSFSRVSLFAAQFDAEEQNVIVQENNQSDASHSESQKKIALVIGNARYKGTFEALANPVNDAKDLQGKLIDIGFEVNCITDADRKTMYEAFKKFYTECQTADIALLYYSGHGVESNGENYLIPVQANISSEADLDSDAVLLNRVVEQSLDVLGGASGGNLVVILDACRSNPLAKTRGASRGLAVIDATPVAGYIIAYSCRPGTFALDGDGRHSPFTAALLNHIDEPNVSFTDILGVVRGEVQEATQNMQLPSYTAEISSPLYLNGKGKVSPRKTTGSVTASASALYVVVIVLLCVLLVATVTLFLLLTERGRRAVAKASESVVRGVSAGRKKATAFAQVAQQKINNVKQSVLSKTESKKEVFVQPEIQSKVLDSVVVGKSLIVAKTPVTLAQWNEVMQQNVALETVQKDYPVTGVSWYDALSFLNALSVKDNLEPVYNLSDPNNVLVDNSKNGWRLPSKKEWLSAAGHASLVNADSQMWYDKNAEGSLHACAQKEANKAGLYDMFGLVWEWCSDSPCSGQRALMGGSWDCDCSWALSRKMQSVLASYKSDNTGFRGVRSI